MPRSENQKEKLVRLIEIFMQRTDEEVGLTMTEIIEALAEYGIKAERKSLYNDFLVLESLGFSVVRLSGNPPAYTLAERIFESAELKMLVDAVESSKFITANKSRELIGKLKIFAGAKTSGELDRQVFVEDRVKSENSAVLYTVDTIHKAINSNTKISFAYFDYDRSKKKILRHAGERYLVSPKMLIWSEENYYLVAYDEREGLIKNFRVDKMVKTKSEGELCSISADKYKLNPADYSRKIFGMYGGKEELVTLEVRERLAGVMIDRFGINNSFIKTDFGFRMAINVMISPTFYSWVMGFGKDIKILKPDYVRADYIQRLKEISDIYKEQN